MISIKKLSPLENVIPNSRVLASYSELVFVDRNGEVIGELDEDRFTVMVFNSYTHSKNVLYKLRKAGFQAAIISGESIHVKADLLEQD